MKKSKHEEDEDGKREGAEQPPEREDQPETAGKVEGEIDGVQTPNPISDPSQIERK